MYLRYGIVLTQALREDLIREIQTASGLESDGARFVEKQSNRVTVWDVRLPDNPEVELVRVCYDKIRKEIITVLPKEAISGGDADEGGKLQGGQQG